MKKINVLLVEEDPDWRGYITAWLQEEPDLCIIGNVETKEEIVRLVQLLDIDVVLMELMLKRSVEEGIEVSLELHALQKSKVIVLTTVDQAETIIEAFASGVCNYLVKTHQANLPEIIRSVHSNRSSIHYVAARVLRQEFIRVKQLEWRRQLTQAESGILQMIHDGYTHAQIMDRLYISESTIKTHVNRILRKFNVRTSKEAARRAKLRGIL